MKKIILACFLVISFLMTSLSALASNDTESQKPEKVKQESKEEYTDIEGIWCQESIEKYGKPEIFSVGNGKFYPNQEITRMEFVRMLHHALDIHINYFAAPDITDFYHDVKNEDTGANELYDLVSVGVIDKKDSFEPDKQLDRDEMIHYIINALKYKTDGNYALIKMMPAPFDDDENIKPEYKNDIIEAVLLKLIHGRGNNMLFPQQGATRGEAAAVIDRLMNLVRILVPDVSVTASANVIDGALQMSLTIENKIDKDITINHSSGQKYDFAFIDAKGETQYCWSADKLFTMASTLTVIKTGEKIEFTEVLDKDAYDLIKDKAVLMKAYIIGTSEDFEINPNGYQAEITR